MKKWKILFWGLLFVNLFAAALVLILIFQPLNEDNPIQRPNKQHEFVELSFETNKTNLNQLINHFLQKEANNEALNYQVVLDRDVELIGAINVFNSDVNFKMSFIPEIQENGDMLLRQKSISIGIIQLPVPIVLNYVKKHYPMPEWVIIQPNNESIYVALQKMRTKSGFKVKVKEFDLINDIISFKLAVPLDEK